MTKLFTTGIEIPGSVEELLRLSRNLDALEDSLAQPQADSDIKTLIVKNSSTNPELTGYEFTAIPLTDEVISRLRSAHAVVKAAYERQEQNRTPIVDPYMTAHLFHHHLKGLTFTFGLLGLNEMGIYPSLFREEEGERWIVVNRDLRPFEFSPNVKCTSGASLLMYHNGSFELFNTPEHESGRLISDYVWAAELNESAEFKILEI